MLTLVAMLARSEVVRQVTQVFCLERVAVGDVVTARALLATLIQVDLQCNSHGMKRGTSGGVTHTL